MVEVNFTLPRKNFDVVISETFHDGITGIYGPSGSGKTSLMHSIAGLATPKAGHISVNEKVLFDSDKKINLPVQKRNIGYVFQEGRLFSHMSVEKNLLYGIKKDKQSKIQFDEVVDMLNLGRLLNSKPMQISGGERQRTALGRSLLSSPDILLLDEPFSAVDTNLRNQIIPFLFNIHTKTNIPILVVSHDLADLLKLSNTICVIQNGHCLGNNEYFELLKQENIANILGTKDIVNSVCLYVETVDYKSGLTILWDGISENRVKVKSDIDKTVYKVGEQINFLLNADDIALSKEKQYGLTIQNQLKGKVTDLTSIGSGTLCKIDVGFTLTVEITTESLKRMGIDVGIMVWCLFKSVAVELL